MRNLQKDLDICNQATPPPWNGEENTGVEPVFETGCGCCTESTLSKEDAEFIAEAREGWPHAIERAIKAEAEVERLRMALDKIANPLKYMQMEARTKGAELNGVYAIMLSKDPSYLQDIALSELDKEGKR